MHVVLQPTNCPKCGGGLSVSRWRPARWRLGAVLVFSGGAVTSGMLLLAAIPCSWGLAAAVLRLFGYGPPQAADQALVQWMESRALLRWVVVYPITCLIALIPAYLCGRIARRMPQGVHLDCHGCEWRGEGLQRQQPRSRQRDADKGAEGAERKKGW
jgi:hypothetical protein